MPRSGKKEGGFLRLRRKEKKKNLKRFTNRGKRKTARKAPKKRRKISRKIIEKKLFIYWLFRPPRNTPKKNVVSLQRRIKISTSEDWRNTAESSIQLKV